MENYQLKYFLASNSCEGFISSFGDCYDALNGWRAYLIKGGPGTGKSSFMKHIAKKADEKNIKTEFFPCSSDPDSLDAVIFPDKKIVILDGTAPHTLDPTFPAVCEQILNFGEFWDSNSIAKNNNEILKLTLENKSLHRTASYYLKAIGELITDNLKTAEACTDKVKVDAYAKTLCKKLIPKGKGDGKEWVRYLCAVTPKGIIQYTDTVLNSTKKTIIISDEYGSAANIIMHRIKDFALDNGYEIITVKNTFLPSKLIDHIIIPKLSLSFVREYKFQRFCSPVRRIHARRFISAEQLSKSRERMRFNKKAINHLLSSACLILAQAKATHDQLESYYINAMDFESLNKYTEQFTDEIFK